MTRNNNPLEGEVLNDVCVWLQQKGYFFWRANNVPVYAMNNAGKMTFRSLPKFTPRGLPDINLVHNTQYIGIEVKRMGAKLRPEQEDFKMNVSAHGGIYLCIHSVRELQDCFLGLGLYSRQ